MAIGGLEGTIQHALAFIETHRDFVTLFVFLLGFGESLILVSLFIPSTVLFLAIGAIDSASGGTFMPVWLAGAAGAMCGDLVSFAAGRHLRGDINRLWPFSSHPRMLARGRLMFSRWGAGTIIAGKFMGTLRPFLPVLAGAMRMQWMRFSVASATSSLLWAGVFLAPGYGIALLWS